METHMKQKKTKNYYPLLAIVPALIIYTVFAIVPIIISFSLSFTDWNIERMFAPEFTGLKNYLELIQDEVFIRSIGNTLLFAFGTTILKTSVGLLLALVLSRSFKGCNLLRMVYYAPCVISITVVGVLFKSILANEGLLNQALQFLGMESLTQDWLASYATAMTSVVLVETWMWAGFNMFIFIAGLQAISKDYYESANIEGATKWEQFKHITIPLLMPSLTVVITLSVAGGLKVFDVIYVLTNGGPGFDTQVLSTFTYQSFSLGLLGESSAGSIILAIIVVALSFSMNHFFAKREVEI